MVSLVDRPDSVLSDIRVRRIVFLVAVDPLADAARMNFRAKSTFRAGDFARLEAQLVPKLITGATAAAAAVLEISQSRVPVKTGRLKSSGSYSVTWSGQRVSGLITYSAPYSAFVEFGIRQRGAAGEWAGPFSYSEGTGFAGFGFMRGALDIGRQQTVYAFRSALGV